jgi:hypothetical protein
MLGVKARDLWGWDLDVRRSDDVVNPRRPSQRTKAHAVVLVTLV